MGTGKIRITQLANATGLELATSIVQDALLADTVAVVGLGVPLLCLNPVQISMYALYE